MVLRLCLFGASDDTGNLGVSALLRGVLAGIAARAPDAEVVVFDHGRGSGPASATLGDEPFEYLRVGAPYTRRVHNPESFARLWLDQAVGTSRHPGIRALRSADAVLAIAGGDSFADIYGRSRLRSVTAPMELSLDLHRPLVLLPQTYGPYRSQGMRQQAERIVRGASMGWARDPRGHDVLLDLVGPDDDPSRYKLGVDVAFAVPLAGRETVARTYGGVRGLLAEPDDGPELVALNVSGLLANGGQQFGGTLSAEYREVMARLVRHVLQADREARVVLVPHVIGAASESDEPACRELADELGTRVVAAPPTADPGVAKALIARASWFCGARMHATIAALSTGVPAAAIAYSDKFAGVFEGVGRGSAVADARALDGDELVRTLVDSYERRHADRPGLERAAAATRERAREQLDEVLALAGAA